jgi:transposase
MRTETFITKALGLRAHRVVKIEEDEAARNLVVHLDRREHRRLQSGECGRGAGRIVPTRRPTRRWRDLALREHLVELAYAPCRVWCARCGLRVERVPVGGELAASNARVGARGRQFGSGACNTDGGTRCTRLASMRSAGSRASGTSRS